MNRKIVAVWLGLAMLFCFIVIVVDVTPPVKAATITVDDSGGGDYFTIQEAIDAANPGDTVFVYNGTYYENILIDKTLNLNGEDGGNTTIDGGGSGDVVFITADWVNISGFTIIGAGPGWNNAGIEFNNARNCIINNSNVSSNQNLGIYLYYSYKINITNNNISNNIYGINIYRSEWIIISNNIFSMCGIVIDGSSLEEWNTHYIEASNTVNGKPIRYWKNQTGGTVPLGAGQIIIANCTNVRIENQEITFTSIGIQVGRSSNNNLIGNNVSNNNLYNIQLFSSNDNNITDNHVSESESGIYLEISNGNIIMGNNASDNDIGINLGWWANDNEITNNTVSNIGDGIRLFNSNRNDINNNTASFNNGNGIYIRSSSENNITNNNAFFNSGFGINLDSSDSNKLRGNILSNNKYAIYLFASIGNNLSDNIMLENGIYPNGNLIEHWNTHDIDTSNIVNGKPVYYWKNKTSGVIPSDAGQIILANCQNIKIEAFEINNSSIGIHLGFSMFCNISYNNLSGNIIGIMLSYSNWNIITHNNASDNSAGIYIIYSNWNSIAHNNVTSSSYSGIVLVYSNWNNVIENNASSVNDEGIYLRYSDNNNVTANDVSNNQFGISLYESHINNITNNNASYDTYGIYFSRSNENHINSNDLLNNIFGFELSSTSDINIFTGNNVLDNNYGVYVYSSNGNHIIDNNISNNNRGIYLWSSSNNNKITENIVSSNTLWGIYLQSTSGNIIYQNNFINNTNQAFDDREDNYWDNGYPVGGNFWSDYNGNDSFKGPLQDQPGSDGIGDTNYSIDSDSIDNYPLMEPYADKPLENYTILKQGWNLISIPLIQNDQSLKKVLEMIDGYYDAVQWFDNKHAKHPWKHLKIGKPFGNDLFELNETISFWIHMTHPGDTFFIYNGTQPTSNQTIQLYKGWNMVGYPSLTSHNRTQGLNNLTFNSDVDAIQWYNAATQIWHFMDQDDSFVPGRGYWMHSKVESEWEVPL